MREFSNDLRAWAYPRRWAILGGLTPVVLTWALFGVLTGRWLIVLAGFFGVLIGASGVAMFVGQPESWTNPQRRWRLLGWWCLAWTTIIVGIVCLVFILT